MNTTTEKANTFVHENITLATQYDSYLVDLGARPYVDKSVRGQIAIVATGARNMPYEGEPIARLTVAIPNVPLMPGEIIINTNLIGLNGLNSLLSCGLIEAEENRRMVPSGYYMYLVAMLSTHAYAWVRAQLSNITNSMHH